MKQSRRMSMVESITNVTIGYGLAVATQVMVFPLFGMHISLGNNALVGLVFTAVSIIRSYSLRRLFEALRAMRVEHR